LRSHPAIAVITLALSFIVCCGATSGSCNTSNERIGPSEGEVVGVAVAAVAVVAVTAVVLVEVSHSHHTVKGCVFSGSNGLELRTDDNKIYALGGTTADIAAGNTVRLHGNHQKHDKNAPDDQAFLVQKMQKNYGPCQALAPNKPPPAPQP
jgi:hypothetical protein